MKLPYNIKPMTETIYKQQKFLHVTSLETFILFLNKVLTFFHKFPFVLCSDFCNKVVNEVYLKMLKNMLITA